MKTAIRLSGSFLCLAFLFVIVEPLLRYMENAAILLPYTVTIVLVVAVGAIGVGIHKALEKHTIRMENRTLRFIIQGVVLLSVVTVFFVLRMPGMERISSEDIIQTEYYKAAAIGVESASVAKMNVAQTAYTNLNSVLFLFLGNKDFLMPMLQMLCQLVLLICLYCAGNALTGCLAGVIPALTVAVSPVFVQGMQEISPHNMTAMLFGIWLLLYALFVRKEESGKWNYAKLTGLGIATGYLGYIWLPGILGLFMVFASVFMKKNTVIKHKIRDFAVFLATGVITYGLLSMLQSSNVAGIAMDVNQNLHAAQGVNWLLSHGILTLGGILFAISGFWHKEAKNITLFILFAGVIVSRFAGFGYGESASLSMVYQMVLSLMAGAGIWQMFMPDRSRVALAGVPVLVEPVVEEKTVAEDTLVAESVDVPKKEIVYIENPLPLPKKHEKKQMGYAFEPTEQQMHYDLELSDDNNFYDID